MNADIINYPYETLEAIKVNSKSPENAFELL